MTIHQVTVLIAPEPFETKTDRSYLDSFLIKTNNTALFKDTITRTLLIEDDDENFNDAVYFNHHYRPDLADYSGQTVVEDFDFGWPDGNSGSHIAVHGTSLSWIGGKIIKDGDGNRFVVTFPVLNQKHPTTNSDRDEDGIYRVAKNETFGDRQAVIIIPLNKVDETGAEILNEAKEPTLSVFDKTAIFSDGRLFYQSTGTPEYLEYASAENIKCFVQGSLIQTQSGLRAVETLQKGDLVLTRDNGLQPVVWIGHTALAPEQTARNPRIRPVLIKKNALGPDVPDRDLMVSPQHRIFVKSEIAQRMFGRDEILVAAKHLLELPGVEIINPKESVTYWHILLPQHDLLFSHGAWSESFFLGTYTMRTLARETRVELRSLFPEILQPDFIPRPARRLLTGREGRKLAQRHLKNRKPLSSPVEQPCLRCLEEEVISMT